MSDTKIAVVIPGFGDPHWDHKIQILRNNLDTIRQGPWSVDVFISQYDFNHEFPKDILYDTSIHITKEKGILGRNLYYHAPPSNLQDYKYVILLLDDVELVAPLDWDSVLSLKEVCKMDMVSPCLVDPRMSVWNFMIHVPSDIVLKEMTVCELFCYFMDIDTYKRYFEFVDPENPWMWGMDFMLKTHMNLRVGILNQVQMIHHYWRVTDTVDPKYNPRTDSEKYLTKYETNWEQLKSIPTTLGLYRIS